MRLPATGFLGPPLPRLPVGRGDRSVAEQFHPRHIPWTVTEAAEKLGCTRQTFSRLLNGRTGISPAMALALERIGWSNAAFWVRRQAQYDLAQERIRQERVVA